MPVVTRFPTTNAAYSGAGFTNPNNLHADDGVYGTSAPAKNGTLGSRYGTFGFDGVIPAGSTISTVKIVYEFKVSVNTSVAVQRVKARIGGVDEENHDNPAEPTIDTVVTVDITADRTWTRADLLNGTFEVVAEATRGNTNTAYTASWDYVKVEVTYAAPTVATTLAEVFLREMAPQDFLITPVVPQNAARGYEYTTVRMGNNGMVTAGAHLTEGQGFSAAVEQSVVDMLRAWYNLPS